MGSSSLLTQAVLNGANQSAVARRSPGTMQNLNLLNSRPNIFGYQQPNMQNNLGMLRSRPMIQPNQQFQMPMNRMQYMNPMADPMGRFAGLLQQQPMTQQQQPSAQPPMNDLQQV